MTTAGPTDRFVAANGLRLHVLDWGGHGTPVLLLHATGFHAHLWDPIARQLSPRYRVFALDARGHGDSEKPEDGYDWSAFIADVIGFMDALGLDGALGAGHSLGATTLAGVASQRPDLFERIVLLDMILFPREFRGLSEAENPMAVAARKRREHWRSREAIFQSYRPRAPFDTWREECLRLYIDHGTELGDDGSAQLKCPGRIEAQVFGMASTFDAWEVLERVTVPTLLVRGERSETLSERDAAQALGRVRLGRLLTMKATTHFIPMEEPEAVVAAIEEFAAYTPDLRAD
jgi:pimeloyl-ACP methyl ester carboxylesterase